MELNCQSNVVRSVFFLFADVCFRKKNSVLQVNLIRYYIKSNCKFSYQEQWVETNQKLLIFSRNIKYCTWKLLHQGEGKDRQRSRFTVIGKGRHQ